jgi:hypothetical protein
VLRMNGDKNNNNNTAMHSVASVCAFNKNINNTSHVTAASRVFQTSMYGVDDKGGGGKGKEEATFDYPNGHDKKNEVSNCCLLLYISYTCLLSFVSIHFTSSHSSIRIRLNFLTFLH